MGADIMGVIGFSGKSAAPGFQLNAALVNSDIAVIEHQFRRGLGRPQANRRQHQHQ
jgi:hypothetical protein